MLKNISILLSVPAATNEVSILDQMKHLVETLEAMYKDGYGAGNHIGFLGSIQQYIYDIRADGLYERFNTLLNMLKMYLKLTLGIYPR